MAAAAAMSSATTVSSIPRVDLMLDNDAGIYLAEQPYAACRRIAVIVRAEELARNGFFEAVCVNRGLRLKVFGDEENAAAWLLEGLAA